MTHIRSCAVLNPRAARLGMLLPLALLAACTGNGPGNQTEQPQAQPTQPLAVETPPPDYPAELACDGVGGHVGLLMKIGTDGTPKNIRVEDGSGYAALDQAAIEAVKHWRFQPATRRGEAMETDLRVPVTFTAPTMRPDMCFQLDDQRKNQQ